MYKYATRYMAKCQHSVAHQLIMLYCDAVTLWHCIYQTLFSPSHNSLDDGYAVYVCEASVNRNIVVCYLVCANRTGAVRNNAQRM